ncbi:MAG: hypothetical protein J6T10_01425 [Methanobrevibacter sp.]|nr:hypothetical protein [Methanobrevibacter sp.]
MNNTTKMCSRELLASTILNMVNDGKAVSVTDGVWKLSGVDTGEGSKDYLVKVTKKLGKSGKYFNKRELYRMDGETERMIELGEYKKKYLYPIIKNLVNPPQPRKRQLEMPNSIEEVLKIRDEVKQNFDKFYIDEKGSLHGMTHLGQMEITAGFVKNMKNNHKRNFGRKMFINGVLTHEGALLDVPVDTYKRIQAKKSK